MAGAAGTLLAIMLAVPVLLFVHPVAMFNVLGQSWRAMPIGLFYGMLIPVAVHVLGRRWAYPMAMLVAASSALWISYLGATAFVVAFLSEAEVALHMGGPLVEWPRAWFGWAFGAAVPASLGGGLAVWIYDRWLDLRERRSDAASIRARWRD